MTLTAHVIADLEWVIAYWPDLTESRLPGTARPWRQPELSPEQRAELDHAARIERAERSDDAWGETPAPVDVGVLDLLASLLWDADTIAGHCVVVPYAPAPELPSTAFADARPYLAYAVAHLGAVDELVMHAVATLTRSMKDQIAHSLCLLYDGQRLDVTCPWCEGRTEAAPVGGARTWRVRQLPGDLVAIVCEGICEPPSKSVGTWWRGQPCWPVSEWDWLAKQVTATEKRGKVAV